MSLSGCTTLKQLFYDTFLDPTQPIFDSPESAIIGIRHEVGFYEQASGVIPKDATDPVPEDLEVRREDYQLAPGDTLIIQVFELYAVGTEATLPRRISERGFISLPKVQPLAVAGLTERQVELAVAKAYREAGVLQDPQVTVTAQTRSNRRFYVIGPFNTPGAFDIPSVDFRLLQAVGLVGGLANVTTEWIYVIRSGPSQLPPPDVGVEVAPPGEPPTPSLPAVPVMPLPGQPPAGQPPATAPQIPEGLERYMPKGVPGPAPAGPQGPAPPPTAPDHNGARGAGPGGGLNGSWMIVDGKWTYVTRPARAGESAEPAPAAPKNRILGIPLGPLRAGEPRYNIVVRPNDVIVAPLPVIGEFYVTGNVARPGVYSLSDRKITLTQAIAAAGGFGPLAIPSRVQLTRRLSPDQSQMFLVDAESIVRGRGEDYALKPYDVINVGTAVYAPFLAVIRNAFRATYGVGFVYDRNFADIDSYSSRPNPHH